MSLRTDVHTAFDQIAPRTGGMAERIVQSAISPPARERVKWPRLRVPLAAVAAFLLVALAVGVLAGGRLYRNWSSLGSRPAHTNGLATLEARPLHLPAVGADGSCPARQKGTVSGEGGQHFGGGPVYGDPVGVDSSTAWGTYGFEWLLTDRGLTGPVIERGRDLVTGAPLGFVGTFAAGPVTGTDVDRNGLIVKQHREALLDTDHPPQDTNPPEVNFAGSNQYVAWQINVALPVGASGCVAMQFDGSGFSEVFVLPPGDFFVAPLTPPKS